MGFRVGSFDREQVGPLRPFCPAYTKNSIVDVDLEDLKQAGKSLILLDVDHTLVKWKSEDFSPEVLAWLDKAKALGFDLCIISNTRRVERLKRLSERLGIPTVRGKFKPSPAMFRLALIKFKKETHEAIMIGDQLMTDILGANRAGIDAIWVQKMDGPEFVGTRFNRLIEKFVSGFIYQALVTPVDEGDAGPVGVSFLERPIVRQFIKFCIVGGTSFAIDYAIRKGLQEMIRLENGDLLSYRAGTWLQQNSNLFNFAETPNKAFAPIAFIIASLVATFNSFIWNRSWTFQIKGKEERAKQLRRLYLVSYIGLGINALITTILYTQVHLGLFVSTFVGAFVAAFWNFAGQRFYAFKTPKASGS